MMKAPTVNDLQREKTEHSASERNPEKKTDRKTQKYPAAKAPENIKQIKKSSVLVQSENYLHVHEHFNLKYSQKWHLFFNNLDD